MINILDSFVPVLLFRRAVELKAHALENTPLIG